MRALGKLQAHRVRYNVLACVNRRSAAEPLRVYEFMRTHGISHIQFIPVVERLPGAADRAIGLDGNRVDVKNGAYNRALVGQYGQDNQAYVSQTGLGGAVLVPQFGNNMTATISQRGGRQVRCARSSGTSLIAHVERLQN
ncbi:arylsulfatase-activating protein [Cupriavidus sp. GA3-3]|uniref:arylsulfatase-activating protein n=1 Tax=Cupriavidus sp. GA3-3 TaxID=1229514 RepID=UPI00032F1794|nr:arylsulfatase-activating protein [Cupriavidus sp. GA3-3]EON18818.1 arylsulfatase-activating protein [Cupriavidus sp. GA3-3]